jgi:hypothetical protein
MTGRTPVNSRTPLHGFAKVRPLLLCSLTCAMDGRLVTVTVSDPWEFLDENEASPSRAAPRLKKAERVSFCRHNAREPRV